MPVVHSLRLRLLLVLVLVALVPVGTAAYLIQRATANAFSTYSTERTKADAESIVRQIDDLTGKPAYVVDANMAVMAESSAGDAGVYSGDANSPPVAFADASTGTSASFGGGSSAIEAVEAGTASGGVITIGGVTSSPNGITIELPGLPDEQFLNEMSRALKVAVAVAAVSALLLAALLAKQILRPVETLTDAARGMAGGDLGRRVYVSSRDEIGVLAGAFNSMADSRARLDELRRNLVNDVAHELRTPLANLQGYLEVLRDGLTPPTPEVLAILHDESLLLSRLVADLQELALAEAGELPLAPEPVALAEPVARALDAHRPAADAKAVSLEARLPDDLPLVAVDAARFSQILRNLLRNAIAHTPAGGTIAVDASNRGSEMVLSVRDSGVGIPPEHLPFVFDRFYRADPARARATGGSGLGLAIVTQRVEAHGGRIDVASGSGVGTTFTFTLPLAIERSAAVAARGQLVFTGSEYRFG
ncbi:MAG: HAMP domain-containing histidine kinase [Thermomicrobiales bacterium]|nr:HAMP domain-containing histidine kinase [Thermomicrobiales bacterium]